MWGTVGEMLIVLNLNHGPWLGGDYLKRKQEGLKMLLRCKQDSPEFYDDFKDFYAFDSKVASIDAGVPDLLMATESSQNAGDYAP